MTPRQHESPSPEALVAQVRALLDDRDVAAAQALAESLRSRRATEAVGRLLCGIVAYHRGFLDLAWERLADLPRMMWAEHAAEEYARAGMHADTERVIAEIADLAAERASHLASDVCVTLIGPLLAVDRPDLARPLFAVLEERAAHHDDALRGRIEGLRPWVEGELGNVAPPPSGTTFAVLDYRRPLEGSKNIGDHVQSIAALSHLVRHQGVTVTGEAELVDLLTHLQQRVRPELRLHDVEGSVEVITAQRDASSYQRIPDGTWTLCFGWYMHRILGYRYDFPLNPGLRPIFVSLHCNKRGLLTEPVIDYLKRYGPVGCRDWTTVYLLLSMGVPAFFSGCLTTTIGTLFGNRPGEADLGAGYVDVRADEVPDGAIRYQHGLQEVHDRSFAANCLAALDRLETYRRHARIITSRLHCYLPMRSLGEPVEFRPANYSDPRFDGLIDIDDDEFTTMRSGLSDKLEQVLTAILRGAPEEEVYTLWRDLTAADVESARARAYADAGPLRGSERLTPAIERSVAGAIHLPATDPAADPASGGSEVACAVVLGGRAGEAKRLRRTLASLTRHTTRRLHLRIISDRPRPRLQDELAAALPSVSFTWLVNSDGEGDRVDGAPTLADWTRTALPGLLPDVDRVILLPAEAVVTGDVGELHDLDLEGHLFAAPTVVGAASSGFRLIHRAAARLNEQTSRSTELVRTAYAAHAFDFDAFSTEVMVLDLATMRAEGFVGRALAVAERFDLNERETLHYLVGPNRAVLHPTWSRVPTRSAAREGLLTHWTGEAKPWDDLYVPDQALWRRSARH